MDNADRLLDEMLLLRYQTGDDLAFEQIVRRYHGPLLYFVRRMIAPGDGADDVLQQVWMAAYQQLPRLRHTDALRVWLYRTARNLAIRGLRRKPREMPVESLDQVPDEPEAEFGPEDAAAVHAALIRLSAEHREVLVLRFMEQMSYEEIADTVGRDLGTIRSRLYYGKRALRRELEQTL